MSGFSFSHLSGPQVLDGYSQAKASNRASDAVLLAYLAEIDERKLFLEDAHSSMHAFVVAEFEVTRDVAENRIREARTARAFPEIFPMLTEGRLRKRTLLLLAPHLRSTNASELLSAAAGKTKAEVEQMLAERFPRTEMISWTMGPRSTAPSPDSEVVESTPETPATSPETGPEQNCETEPVPGRVGMTTHALAPATPAAAFPLATPPRTCITPIAANAYGVQFMMDKVAHDDLEYLRAVLGHEAPTVAKVIALALKSLRRDVDKRKFGMTDRPRRPRATPSTNPRRIPAHIRRAVRMRDQFRCSFVGGNDKRCDARAGLEIDHIVPVAQGGTSTVDNLRLLCRAHNQHAADRTFGVEFMGRKRRAARQARSRRDVARAPAARAAARDS